MPGWQQEGGTTLLREGRSYATLYRVSRFTNKDISINGIAGVQPIILIEGDDFESRDYIER